jgi:Voltage-dependent anion channel
VIVHAISLRDVRAVAVRLGRIITLIWYRLAVYQEGDAIMVPTLWIVLGPLGQSIAAANLLGGVAHEALPMPYSTALQAFGVVYGMMGVRPAVGAIAGVITMRAAADTYRSR